MKKAAVATLGCKVNQVESGSIIEQLTDLYYTIVDFSQPADLYIINTCTVTNRTDFKSRSLIRQALKQKNIDPGVRIIVTGCYAQKEPDEVRALEGIDVLVDNQAKVDVRRWLDNAEYHFQDIMTADEMLWKPIKSLHEHTRAFLKIQDGCDYYCSYCAVPYGRGHVRSLDFDKVIEQAEILVDNGYKEIVLSGVNLGLYRDKKTAKSLAEVIKALVEIEGLNLLRLSSIEPDLWSEELLQTIKLSDKICSHFHIPLQSGSDSVLQRMGRRYFATHVSQLVSKLRAIRPDCAIGLDVISGFPGETDDEHQQTIDFLTELNPAYLHVFGYSKRKGTPAAKMTNQINGEISRQRVQELTNLSNTAKERYKQSLITEEVSLSGIVEKVQNGFARGLSDHYIRLYISSAKLSENDFVEGTAVRLDKDGIMLKNDAPDGNSR
ncbi:MAG: tRNA (N(6)-L-threonylcarbamoyladenosine(37)-C(2))-methylthiotransferase MtaB [Candidatus Cloacimonadaceae bacterium]